MDTPALNKEISQFYDQSTNLWLETWGEHMHHGFYGKGGVEKKERRQAQIDLITELLTWGNIKKADRIFDAGCGVGGSARFLCTKYDAQVYGVTLSKVQAEKANIISGEARLTSKIQIDLRNVLDINEQDGEFDLIWSMESAEHIAEKEKLLKIFYDRLKPGGKFLMATWCIRNNPPNLNAKELSLLKNLEHYYHLSSMISIEKYAVLAKNNGFEDVKTDDWSEAVAPFWQAVLRSAINMDSVKGLLRSGISTLKGAWAIQYMIRGYRMGTIRYGVFQGVKS